MSNALYSELLGRETFPALALMQIVLEGKEKICHTCDTRFCDRTNIAFFDLLSSKDKVQLAFDMVNKE